MFNNLDVYLVKDSLTQNLKAQFKATSQKSLTPVYRPTNKPQARQEKTPGSNQPIWAYKTYWQEPEQN